MKLFCSGCKNDVTIFSMVCEEMKFLPIVASILASHYCKPPDCLGSTAYGKTNTQEEPVKQLASSVFHACSMVSFSFFSLMT